MRAPHGLGAANERLVAVPIEVGVADGSNVEVKGGELAEGDVIVTDALDKNERAEAKENEGRALLMDDAAAPPALVEITGVTKTYRMGDFDVNALRGVNLTIGPASSSPSWAPRARASRP